MTDIVITIIGITAALALVIFIAYKGITTTPKTGNQRSDPSKRPLQRPRKGSPNRYGLRELSLDLGCWFPSFIVEAFRWIFSGIVKIVSSLFRWLIIIIALLVLTPFQIQPASNGQLPKPTGGLRILNLLNKGWAKVSPGSLRTQSYFHAWYRWYADRFVYMHITEFDRDSGLYESWYGPSPSVVYPSSVDEVKEWDFKYYRHDYFDKEWRYKVEYGEEFKFPEGGWISHANTRTYSMTYRIKSYYRKGGRAPGMPDTYQVTLDYQLEDLSYDENGLSRVTRDDWEKAKKYDMSGTSNDVAYMDILDHGEGLIKAETSGFVHRKRTWCWTTGMAIEACVVETCEGQPCTQSCNMFRRGDPMI